MSARKASCAIVGAGDYIGAAVAKKFAAEGYSVYMGRRGGEKLAPLVAEIEAAGGEAVGVTLDAREEDQVAQFFADAHAHEPLEVAIFNVGGNVHAPILETTERVFRKVWLMATYAGFLSGREAARHLVPQGRGSIFFTGATASMRGAAGFAAFASAKAGLRAMAQSMARELGPDGIHVAHLVIDAGVDTEWVHQRRAAAGKPIEAGDLLQPASIGETYWMLHTQPRDAWTFELDIRPFKEKW